MTVNKPGPFTLLKRPKRKTTARSHCAAMRIVEARMPETMPHPTIVRIRKGSKKCAVSLKIKKPPPTARSRKSMQPTEFDTFASACCGCDGAKRCLWIAFWIASFTGSKFDIFSYQSKYETSEDYDAPRTPTTWIRSLLPLGRSSV